MEHLDKINAYQMIKMNSFKLLERLMLSHNVLTSFGNNVANELTVNDDKAPMPTKVFMLGVPLKRLFMPSTIS